MSVTVSILFSSSRNRYYTGISDDLERRLKQHLAGSTRATAGARDWEVVWRANAADHIAARQLEKQIKARRAQRFSAGQGGA